MNLKIKNLFDQFSSNLLIYIPLSLIGTLFSILWIILTNNTHYLKTRKNLIILFINFIYKELLKKKIKNYKEVWYNWLLTIFFLLLSFNIFRLIPYTFSKTAHFRITFRISFTFWILIQILGFQKNWKKKLSHLLPQGTPIILIPIMILIETIRKLIQPLTLGFRLGANILAGHLLILLCSCVVWNIIRKRFFGFISFILLIVLLILEIAVACIQAAVFLILLKNYMSENIYK